MSIDPAIMTNSLVGTALHLDELTVERGHVYIFDFDGVVASSLEDDIYRLTETQEERALIDACARHFDIRCQDMEQRYQRHLVFQAAAWALELPIEGGPGFDKAMQAGRLASLFVLTARSGWYAVERMRTFLQANEILPIEIYSVGRVKKDRQVELLCREFHSRQITFIDDSIAHLGAVAEHAFPNLGLVWSERRGEPEDTELLRARFNHTVERALSVSVRERLIHGKR